MLSNNLWCVVERDGDKEYAIPEEVFLSRDEARKYLKELKGQLRDVRKAYDGLYGVNPNDLYIRKLQTTGKRG